MNVEKQNEHREVWKSCLIVIVFFAIILLFKNFVMDKVIVNGTSMLPMYYEGDVLLVKTLGEPQLDRYDIVVANVERKKVLKRVIGLPGETLKIENGYVYVDGERLEDDIDIRMEEAGVLQEELKIATNEYVLLGDNRNGSLDSREWGAISQEQIVGNVVMKIYPWHQVGGNAIGIEMMYYFLLVATDLSIYLLIVTWQKRKRKVCTVIGYIVLCLINAICM